MQEDFYVPTIWAPGFRPSPFLVGDRIVWCKGTSYRQDALRAVLTARYGSLKQVTRTYAWIVREPANAHDPNAAAVYLGERHVGYLAKELAVLMRPTLDDLARRTAWGLPMTFPSCLAQIKFVEDGSILVGLIGPWPEIASAEELPPETPRRRRRRS